MVRAPVQQAFMHGFHASSMLAATAALAGGVLVIVCMPGDGRKPRRAPRLDVGALKHMEAGIAAPARAARVTS
jgi:hypothetical protein